MRFLISRLSALGDTVCSLPAAVALKQTFPDCHITWVVDPRFAGVVECCSAVDEVVQYRPRLGSWPRLAEQFDAAVDLQGLAKSALPVLFARAKKKVGYHWQREGSALVSRKVMPDPTSLHVVDQYVDVARALGAEANRAEFDLAPKEEDVLSVRLKLKERGLNGRFVAMNAGAGWQTKRWPTEHWAKLIGQLAEAGLPAVLIGGPGPDDRTVADQVKQSCEAQPTDMVGETSVRELIALIRLCSAHVGGDTGSTHIAAALNIPAFGLYGITRPQRSCPYGQIARCFVGSSGLADIKPDQVFEAVSKEVL